MTTSKAKKDSKAKARSKKADDKQKNVLEMLKSHGAKIYDDLDNDGHLDIIATSESNTLHMYSFYGLKTSEIIISSTGDPIPATSSPTIYDVDEDGDLEFIFGTPQSLEVLDYKSTAPLNSLWPTYKGNNQRTSYFSWTTSDDIPGVAGDLNQDGLTNLLDLELLVSVIINNQIDNDYDINEDGDITIIDLLSLIDTLQLTAADRQWYLEQIKKRNIKSVKKHDIKHQ